MRKRPPSGSTEAPRSGSPSSTGADPDDTWQAEVSVQVGSVAELNGRPCKRRRKEPMGFDIRPGKNIKPQPHETWGPNPIVIWPGRK